MLIRGCPPLPFLFRGSFPLPLLQAMHWERVLLLGGCPPLLRPLAMHWGRPLPGRGVPLYPLATCRNRVLLCGGSPPYSFPWLCAGGARCLVGCLPPSPGYVWEAHTTQWGDPPPSPPCWMHLLSACYHSGGPCFSSPSSDWPRARSAPCLFSSPVPVSLSSVSPILVVSSGLS